VQLDKKSKDGQEYVKEKANEKELSEFIKEHQSTTAFPKDPVVFEEFKLSDDLRNYKEFLATKTKNLKEKVDEKAKLVSQSEQARDRLIECIQKIIYPAETANKDEDIIPDKQDITDLIVAFHDRDTRMMITDILKHISQPRCVISSKGLKTLGDLIIYMLNALIQERDVNFKIIFAILTSSHLIYFQHNQAQSQTYSLQ
jgi:hypothetical protein